MIETHTKHFEDCGCYSHSKNIQIALLQDQVKELKDALKAQYAISGKCCYAKSPSHIERQKIEELLK